MGSAQRAGSQRGLGLVVEPAVRVTGVPHRAGLSQAGGDWGKAGEEGRKAAVKRRDEGSEAPLQPHPGRCAPIAHRSDGHAEGALEISLPEELLRDPTAHARAAGRGLKTLDVSAHLITSSSLAPVRWPSAGQHILEWLGKGRGVGGEEGGEGGEVLGVAGHVRCKDQPLHVPNHLRPLRSREPVEDAGPEGVVQQLARL
eukprot:CAMPEP_0172190482 /NCGR_PEP_ID=MMETSP1050-20130122/23141_1 /TAXON_ID=233186 /ORGANISM="Cryptomonas curvata, Strain CCAP979/52" /LENGTH=199 /DNA_ID=CAMNT_0012865367 /DNA_START=131 /DNA_END=731 /DNA_ORIENTATION=+